MNNPRGFKQRISNISRLWEEQAYDEAFVEVETLLKIWPGNAHLHTLWANLVQLQENAEHDLDEAKQALQSAVELDKGSPAAAIELGHFLNNIEDDPQAAAIVFGEAAAQARQLLVESLMGQATVFQQMEKREEFLRCILEVLHLDRIESASDLIKVEESGPDFTFESPAGQFHTFQLKGPRGEQIRELLDEMSAVSAG